MAAVALGRSLDWEGGSLDELLTVLAEPALSARVEVRAIGRNEVIGELHVVAGGMAEAFAGDARGDQALDRLRANERLRFRVEPRLPRPSDGGLDPAGPSDGQLGERPPI